MRTTVRLDDLLLQRAWQEAERRGISLATLVEQGLQLVMRLPPKSPGQRAADGPARYADDVIQRKVDPNNRATLLNRIIRRD